MSEDAEERLDVRVARDFGLSRRRAQDAIAAGQVDLGGVRQRNPGVAVSSAVRVTFDPNRRREESVRFSLSVAYQDDQLVVVDKPAGLLSVATDGATREDTVLERLRKDLLGVRGPRAYVGALHRLDRGTSGLLAIALSRECHAKGRAAFREHAYERKYLAIVEGVPRRASGTIDLAIADEYQDGRRHVARDDDEPARRAVTHYRLREAFARHALVELRLETGRQHQIRLHLRAIGHPILGDGVYGRKEHANSRPLLHAWRLAFPHPLNPRQQVACEAPPPRDFVDVLKRLRRR